MDIPAGDTQIIIRGAKFIIAPWPASTSPSQRAASCAGRYGCQFCDAMTVERLRPRKSLWLHPAEWTAPSSYSQFRHQVKEGRRICQDFEVNDRCKASSILTSFVTRTIKRGVASTRSCPTFGDTEIAWRGIVLALFRSNVWSCGPSCA